MPSHKKHLRHATTLFLGALLWGAFLAGMLVNLNFSNLNPPTHNSPAFPQDAGDLIQNTTYTYPTEGAQLQRGITYNVSASLQDDSTINRAYDGGSLTFNRNDAFYSTQSLLSPGTYNATFSFQNDVSGGAAAGWETYPYGAASITVQDSFLGHQKVLRFYDGSGAAGNYFSGKQTFAQQVTGIYSCWFAQSDVNQRVLVPCLFDPSGNVANYMYFSSGNLVQWYRNGTEKVIAPVVNNRWYYLQVSFDCTRKVYNISLDGIQRGTDMRFVDPGAGQCNALSSLRIDDGWDGFASTIYIDAVDYSWDLGWFADRAAKDLSPLGYYNTSESFENDQMFTKPVGFSCTEKAAGDVRVYPQIPTVAGGHRNVLRMSCGSTETDFSYAIKYFSPSQDGTFSHEFYVYFVSVSSGGRIVMKTHGGVGWASLLQFDGSYLGYRVGGATWYSFFRAYTGSWYHIRIVTRISDQKYDVYVNGQLRLASAPFDHSDILGLNNLEIAALKAEAYFDGFANSSDLVYYPNCASFVTLNTTQTFIDPGSYSFRYSLTSGGMTYNGGTWTNFSVRTSPISQTNTFPSEGSNFDTGTTINLTANLWDPLSPNREYEGGYLTINKSGSLYSNQTLLPAGTFNATDSFTNDTVGDVPSGWQKVGTGNVRVEQMSSGHSKTVRISDTSSGTNLMKNITTISAGVLKLDFWNYWTNLGSGSSTEYVGYLQQYSNTYGICLQNQAGTLKYFHSGGGTESIGTTVAGRWYWFHYEVNLDAKRVNIWMNGLQIANNFDWYNTSMSAIRYLWFGTYQTIDFTLDAIDLSTDPGYYASRSAIDISPIGNYNGTYSFENDVPFATPGFAVTERTLGDCRVYPAIPSNATGHKNVLRVNDDTNIGSHACPPVPASGEVTHWFYIQELLTSSQLYNALMTSGWTYAVGIIVVPQGGGGLLQHLPGGSGWTTIMSVSLNTWYFIRIVYSSSYKYDIWVNDKLVVSQANFYTSQAPAVFDAGAYNHAEAFWDGFSMSNDSQHTPERSRQVLLQQNTTLGTPDNIYSFRYVLNSSGSDYPGQWTNFSVADPEWPQAIIGLEDYNNTIYQNWTHQNINWTLDAGPGGMGGFYRVCLNEIPYEDYGYDNWLPWGPGRTKEVEIPVNTSRPFGTWNYTIEYNDSLGFWGPPNEVIINITDPDPPEIRITDYTPDFIVDSGTVAGDFYGSFSFAGDTPGTRPNGFYHPENLNTECLVVDSYGGHAQVVELWDNNGSAFCEATHAFTGGGRDNGTLEFWIATGGTTTAQLIDVQLLNETHEGPDILLNNESIKVCDGVITQTILTGALVSGTFLHVRMRFNCTSDTYELWVNGTAQGNFTFAQNHDLQTITQVRFRTDFVAAGYSAYFDAVGLWWDPNYVAGSNFPCVNWTFTPHDDLNDTYTLYRNGTPVCSAVSWTPGVPVVFPTGNLTEGNVNFTIVAYGKTGIFATRTVIVRVNHAPITTPAAVLVTYARGSVDNWISWTIADGELFEPDAAYTVYRNGTWNATDSWASGIPVEILVDGLNWGDYNFTILGDDGYRANFTSSIIVRIYDQHTNGTWQAIPEGQNLISCTRWGIRRVEVTIYGSYGLSDLWIRITAFDKGICSGKCALPGSVGLFMVELDLKAGNISLPFIGYFYYDPAVLGDMPASNLTVWYRATGARGNWIALDGQVNQLGHYVEVSCPGAGEYVIAIAPPPSVPWDPMQLIWIVGICGAIALVAISVWARRVPLIAGRRVRKIARLQNVIQVLLKEQNSPSEVDREIDKNLEGNSSR